MLGFGRSLERLRGNLMMEKSISIAVINAFGKIVATVLIGCFAVEITALANTVIGKFLLIGSLDGSRSTFLGWSYRVLGRSEKYCVMIHTTSSS